jgi:hypothetical protein
MKTEEIEVLLQKHAQKIDALELKLKAAHQRIDHILNTSTHTY